MRTTLHDRYRCAQNADHFAHNTPFSLFFAEVVCALGTTPTKATQGLSPNGGIALHEAPTRRWHAARGLHVVQNPHERGHGGHRRDGTDTTASQISHVIYRGHFSRCPKHVAIPTTQIQCLNQSSRNYVRNCWLTAIAGHQGNAPSRRTEPPIEAHGTDGSRAAHGAARSHGPARLPETPRAHKQQPASHSNT